MISYLLLGDRTLEAKWQIVQGEVKRGNIS